MSYTGISTEKQFITPRAYDSRNFEDKFTTPEPNSGWDGVKDGSDAGKQMPTDEEIRAVIRRGYVEPAPFAEVSYDFTLPVAQAPEQLTAPVVTEVIDPPVLQSELITLPTEKNRLQKAGRAAALAVGVIKPRHRA